jgi:diguanylate cyclase (GGDEF)-like protein
MSSRALRNDGADYALDARARPSVLRRFEPALEAEYRIFLDAALLLRVRWALGAAVVVLCVYAGLDLIMIPAQILPEVLAMRLGLMVLPPLLVLAVSFHPRCRHLHVLAGLACLAAGLGAVTLIVRTRVLGMPVDYEGVLLLLMYIYGCGAMRLGTAVACGTTICVVYPLAEAWAGLPQDALMARTLFIVTTNVIGIITAWIFDQEARGNFLVTRQLRGMAHRDFLTGLPNRRAFAERIGAIWQDACSGKRPLGIAVIDVDRFKAYNDHYGHPAGDRVLRAVAQVLAAHVRGPGALVARHGGEEFVCAWSDVGLDALRATLQAIQRDIASLDIAHEGAGMTGGRLTVSIGLHYLQPGPGQSMAEALQQADNALYQAKANGRNATVVHRSDGEATTASQSPADAASRADAATTDPALAQPG